MTNKPCTHLLIHEATIALEQADSDAYAEIFDRVPPARRAEFAHRVTIYRQVRQAVRDANKTVEVE